MISSLNADGRPSVWYTKATGEVRGWGYTTFEFDPATQAVDPVDPAVAFDLGRTRYVRQLDGSFATTPRPNTRFEDLRDKRRAGQTLTSAERQEVLDFFLGV